MDYEVKIEQEMKQKYGIKNRIASVLENAKDFVDDHMEGIIMGVYLGGCAIICGQSIRYMHYANKAAKRGIFPGYSR